MKHIEALDKIFNQLAGPFFIEDIKNVREELVVPGLLTIIDQLLEAGGCKKKADQPHLANRPELEKAIGQLQKKEDSFVNTFLGEEINDFVIYNEGKRKTYKCKAYYNKIYRRLVQEKEFILNNQEINYLLSSLLQNSLSRGLLLYLKAADPGLWNKISSQSKKHSFSKSALETWNDIQKTVIDTRTGLAIGSPDKKPFGDTDKIDYRKLQGQINQRITAGVFSVSGIRQIFSSFFKDKPLPLRFPWRLGIDTEPTLAAKVHAAAQAELFAQMLNDPADFAEKIPKNAIPARNTAEQNTIFKQTKKDFITLLQKTQAEKHQRKTKKIAVLLDTRSTGPALADVDIRTLLAHQTEVEYGFTSSACEAAVYVKGNKDIDGGIYISASHNDEGYNGIKLFLGDGRIMPETVAYPYIFVLLKELKGIEHSKELVKRIDDVDPKKIADIYKKIPEVKRKSRKTDWDYRDRVITGAKKDKDIKPLILAIKKQISSLKLGIIIDPNGGAREDAEYFENLGFKVYQINSRPRYDMNHELCPSTAAVEKTDQDLDRIRKKATTDGYKIIGSLHYDTDGDRRNLRPTNQQGEFMLRDDMAQICFALDVLSYVLSKENYNFTKNFPKQILGVACNGPTSALLEELAEKFGFIIIRTQTGEANVADGMEKLSGMTWLEAKKIAQENKEELLVPETLKKQFGKNHDSKKIKVIIAGEGSNGSDFTQELLVRDPLHTIRAIVNFLSPASGPKMVKSFLKKLEKGNEFSPDWWLGENIATIMDKLIGYLPINKTTDFFTMGGPGEMVNPPILAGIVKDNFDVAFKQRAEKKTLQKLATIMKKAGAAIDNISCQYINYEEKAKIGFKKRNKTAPLGRQVGDGGYKIKFWITAMGKTKPYAWIWFRDSITEKGLTRTGVSAVSPSIAGPGQKKQRLIVENSYNFLKEMLGDTLEKAVNKTVRQILQAKLDNLSKNMIPYKDNLAEAQSELKEYTLKQN